MILALACGEGSRNGDHEVRVEFWHAMGGPLGEYLEDTLITEFNETHPGIEVVPVSMGNYRALCQKILASVMADDPPVVAQAYETWTSQLIRGEALVPLDSLMELDSPDIAERWNSDFFSVFRRNNTYRGRIYSFPFNKSVQAIYYNKELMEHLGLSPPDTWESYRMVLDSLTLDGNGDGDLLDDSDRWGTAFDPGVGMFENLLLQNGGALLNSDSTRTAFNSPEGIEALQLLIDLIHEDSSARISSGYTHQNDFLEGKVGLVQGSTVSMAFLESSIERMENSGEQVFTLGIAPLPAGRERAVIIAGTNVILFRSGPEEIRAGWEFIKWFTEPEQQARWSAATGYIPATSSSLSHPAVLELFRKYPGLEDVMLQVEYAYFEPQGTFWYDGRMFLSEAVEIALYGRMSAEEALERAASLSDAELESELD
ncbi:MAG: ABC transporter substrate-binding protein [Candidatus Fermentibacteraceae bacterium]|nr:ABC transporter substrate-binding protein [Candidatus Fermentibacteraceae bacterium]MBN2609013.1 ABC transporter substrate-binding protein [Candidatus Fermentibacteraceae bacterium]